MSFPAAPLPDPPARPSHRWPVVARVALVRWFPLKSGRALHAQSADLHASGVVGDRAWAVADATGSVLRPRENPALADLSTAPATAVPAPRAADAPPLPGAAVPGRGTPAVLHAGRVLDAAALADLLGVAGAHLVALDGPGDPAAARSAVHLVGADAADDPGAPAGADPGRRANLVLDAPPGAERGWAGARLQVGPPSSGALLEVTTTPRGCLGVYARVLAGGRVRVGDAVRLGPAPGQVPGAAGHGAPAPGR